MAAPSQTQLHNWSDRIAALIQKDLGGFLGELSGASAQSLARQVDGSGDQSLEAAMMTASLNIDRQSTPEKLYAALPAILGRSAYSGWFAALEAYAVTADGGAYSGLRALLEDRGAVLHPLVGELLRQQNQGALTDALGDITTVFAPTYSTRAAERFYAGADGALVDDTIDADDAGAADVALFASDNHSVYIGSRYRFSQIIFALSTLANVSVTPTFEFWNGNSWETLTVTDNTDGFTKNDVIKFTPPANWSRSNQDKGSSNLAELTPMFYIRISRTQDTVGTPPVATSVRIVPAAVLNSESGASHLGVDQPPLAIVRITGTNAMVIDPVAGIDYSRFREPGVSARALTPIGSDVTLTLPYVDQEGNDASKAQSAWTSIDALDEVALTLDTGDTGVRSIRSSGGSIVTAATSGVFEIFAPALRTPAL